MRQLLFSVPLDRGGLRPLKMEGHAGADAVFVVAVFGHIVMVIDVQSPAEGDVVVEAGLGFGEMRAFDISRIGLETQDVRCSDADAAVEGRRTRLVVDVVAPAAEELDFRADDVVFGIDVVLVAVLVAVGPFIADRRPRQDFGFGVLFFRADAEADAGFGQDGQGKGLGQGQDRAGQQGCGQFL